MTVTDPRAIDLEMVREAMARHRPSAAVDPRPDRGWQAATALIVAPGPDALEVAFIERVERAGDRWSGHMALPGGRRDPADPDLCVTAAREAEEEIGVHLDEPVGRLDDHRGRSTRTGVVATFVFALADRPELVPAPAEVAAAWWIPLPRLFDPDAATRLRWAGMPFPGIAHEGRVIWGLTHRILGDFGAAVGLQLRR
jgi:8-oxo-dGTP pyrophosphatase MutT (NUDIX family)